MSTIPSDIKIRFLPFIISLLITLSVGISASLFTRPQIAGWYSTLIKPSFNPPSWLFAPVWTILYILIAVAAYLVWQRRSQSTTYATARAVYALQLTLNFLWPLIFFGLHAIAAGLLTIILLWMCILLNIRWFGKISKPASWLLLPYFMWVSFAAILNYSIYMLNR